MKEAILNTIAVAGTLYIAGLAFVLLSVAMGGDGSDMLSQHYRSVIVSIIELVS